MLKTLSPSSQKALSEIVPVLNDWRQRPDLKDLAASIALLVFPQPKYIPNDEVDEAVEAALVVNFEDGAGQVLPGTSLELS